MKIIVLAFLLTGIAATAQEIELDPVTVSSSLHQQKISETGRNIISISGDEFSKLPVHSLDELLRYIPGIEIQQRGPDGSQSDIVIRGGTFQQVLVILDGVRLNDPNTGHFNSYIPIAPAEIDHIEILKGASSAIYGSEAVGGVINIITKTFIALRQAQGNNTKKQVSAEGTSGEYGLANGNIGGFYQKNKTAISGGWLTDNSNGQLQRGTRGYFHNNTASLSFKQALNNNWSIAARSSFDKRDFAAQNFYTTFTSDTASEKVRTWWNQFQLHYQKSKHQLQFDAGYKAVRDQYLYNPSSVANDNHSYLFQTQLTDQYQLSKQINIVSGVQYQRKWIHSNDRGDHTLDQQAAFIIWDQSVKKFSFSPSLRLDHTTNSGTELIPQLNLSYHHKQWQLRGSAGKTIREADFTERYNNYNKTFVSGGSIGNPDLQAERSFSYEAGADYFLSPAIKLSGTFFQRRQNNVIDWVTTSYANMPRKINLSPTGTYALASNISKVTTTGGELDAQFVKAITAYQLLTVNYGLTLLHSATNETTPSFYISSHAKVLTNFTATYSNPFFSFNVNGVYKYRNGQQASAINAYVNSDAFTINSKLSVFVWKQSLSLFMEVDNIGNAKVQDLLGAPLPGRWFMVGIKLKL